MRHTFIASLLLSPMILTASAYATQPTTDSAATSQVRRISTGVSEAKLLDSENLHISAAGLEADFPAGTRVVLALEVDAKGNPENIRVVKSTYPVLNASVVSAASKFHFQPAMLDNKAVSTSLELNVLVQR